MNTKIKQIELIDSDSTSTRKSLLDTLAEANFPSRPTTKKKKSLKAHSVEQISQDEPKIEKNQSDLVQVQQKQKKKTRKKQKQKKFSWPVWRKLFQYTMRRKILAFLGLGFSVAFAISISTLPLKIGLVLDDITKTTQNDTSKNIQQLSKSVEQLLIMVGLLALFTLARYLSMQFLQQFLSIDMKNDFFKKFIQNDIYFFQQYKTGQLVSRLSSDINQAKQAVSSNLAFLIRNVIIIVSNIIILFTLSFKLTLIVMLLVPIYAFITLHYSRRNKVLVKEYQDVAALISAAVTQKFSGIQLVKAYSTQKYEIQAYRQIIDKSYQINKKKLILGGLYTTCSQFLPYIGMAVVLWYGGKMVMEGSSQISAGQLTSFIMYCNSLASSTSSISNSYTNIINGTYAIQKVFDMLNYKPLVEQGVGQQRQITGQIIFNNVTFKYPLSKTVVIKNLSFHIKKGQYIAFVGQSGSGKSTIIKLIQKFYKIQSGQILFGNCNQSHINATCLRRQIGLVNQDATMFSGTIQQNICYGSYQYTHKDIQEAAQRAGCLEFLQNSKRFPKGFQSQVGQKGGNLSGGQKQRISIARALMRKPKIIIFDQATSALDSNSEQMVQHSIQNLASGKQFQKPTIIVIAHRLSTVLNADRIFVMKNGQIVEQGSHKQLKQERGYYYQLVQKQLGQHPQLESPTRQSRTSLKIVQFN